MNQKKMDKFFIELAKTTSTLSKDPSTKVGAVIVKDNRQISTGYNGFPRGLTETDEKWNNKELKHEYVIHAELNAIINCPFDTKGSTLYCTHRPCHRCLGHIVNAGIERVVYLHWYEKVTHRYIQSIWADISDLVKVEQLSKV